MTTYSQQISHIELALLLDKSLQKHFIAEKCYITEIQTVEVDRIWVGAVLLSAYPDTNIKNL